jgi:hypothetical protein
LEALLTEGTMVEQMETNTIAEEVQEQLRKDIAWFLQDWKLKKLNDEEWTALLRVYPERYWGFVCEVISVAREELPTNDVKPQGIELGISEAAVRTLCRNRKIEHRREGTRGRDRSGTILIERRVIEAYNAQRRRLKPGARFSSLARAVLSVPFPPSQRNFAQSQAAIWESSK